jgi:hypothetical protein
MQFAADRPRPYSDPETAARRLVEISNAIETIQDGRIYIQQIHGPLLFEHKASPAEYKAGLELAIARGWLTFDRSGTYVTFTPTGAELFA